LIISILINFDIRINVIEEEEGRDEYNSPEEKEKVVTEDQNISEEKEGLQNATH